MAAVAIRKQLIQPYPSSANNGSFGGNGANGGVINIIK